MRLSEAIQIVQENIDRYSYEVENGCRKSGAPMTERRIEQRKASLVGLKRDMETLRKWSKAKLSPMAFMHRDEMALIAKWEIDIDDVVARMAG